MNIAMFFIGFAAGGLFGVVTMCCFQLKRANDYEREIYKLRQQIKNQK